MTAGLQIFAILGMLLITYIGLLAFGPPRTRLLYTQEEKNEWDSLIQRNFGSWLTSTNIIGTLTSFATVFLFFLGNAGVFGWILFVCSLTIWLGAFVTNHLTRKICAAPHVQRLLASPDQTGGIIASAFWRASRRSRRSSAIVKYISLINIFAVIWLEFSLLADVGGTLLGLESLFSKAVLLFACTLSVFYFVLRFGLRGFVFTDIFQTPIIAVATLLLLVGAALAIWTTAPDLTFGEIIAPAADFWTLVIFSFHVLFLNLFLVVVTEPHWLRVWIFGDKETDLQAKSTFGTAIIWGLVILGGFAATGLAPNAVGQDAVVSFVQSLGNISPAFFSVFWFAGIAALFTTADANVYSFLVVQGFDIKSGRLSQRTLETIRPALFAFVAAGVFVALFLGVRTLSLPFEKLIFLVIPLGLNLLPGLVQLSRQREPNGTFILLSLGGYATCSLIGLFQPERELLWTLLAAFVPVVISISLLPVFTIHEARRK